MDVTGTGRDGRYTRILISDVSKVVSLGHGRFILMHGHEGRRSLETTGNHLARLGVYVTEIDNRCVLRSVR